MEFYLDNYKGFTNTFVALKDVNFLVGENSTGKSALLNIIELVTSPRFWFSPDFNSEEIELGYFSEIVNQNSNDKTSFSLGVLFDSDDSSRIEDGYMWLKFSEKNQTPIVSECRFIANGKTIWCKNIYNSTIECKEKAINLPVDFKSWVKDESDFNEIEDLDMPEHSKLPFGVVRSMIENKLCNFQPSNKIGIRQPVSINHFFWFAPIRAKAKRWYESYKLSYSPEGEHIPVVLKKYLSDDGKKRTKFIDSMNEFGKDSHLFDSIEVRDTSKDAPFSLCVKYGSITSNISNVGYGVSQVLPLVVELLTSRGDSFAIQQPEVHLHPVAQAAFGKLVFDVAAKNRNRIILETHSDYMINRFRYAMSKTRKNNVSSQVLFFERDEEGTHIKEIQIDSTGKFTGEYVADYMKFYVDEELKMLEL